MGKRVRWILAVFREIVIITLLLVLIAHLPFFAGIVPERTGHAVRGAILGLAGEGGGLRSRLAGEQRDAEARRKLLRARSRIEDYFARSKMQALSLSRHASVRELFRKPFDARARTRAKNLIQSLAETSADLDEIIIGKAGTILVQSSRTNLRVFPFSGEAIDEYMRLHERGLAVHTLPGARFLFLIPPQMRRAYTGADSAGEYIAVILNADTLWRFLNEYPRRDALGVYLAWGEDAKDWIISSGEDALVSRLREGNALLEKYADQRFIEVGEDRVRNTYLPVRYGGESDTMLLGVIEREIESNWYMPLLVEGVLFLLSFLLLYWMIRRVCCGVFHFIRNKNRCNALLLRALEESQENCGRLIENTRQLARQAVFAKPRIRTVKLPSIDTRLQSNLLISAEPDLADLRRQISEYRPSPKKKQGEGARD